MRRLIHLYVLCGLFLLGILLGGLRLNGPREDLYPLAGDSLKYHSIAQGFARLYAHPIEGIRLWASREATSEELAAYGFDSWVLQHAPAYTAYLGLGYLLPGDDEKAGRRLTVLLFALGAVFLFLLTRALFGLPAGVAATLVYLFWPAHWMYGTAILTEIPVAAMGLATGYALLRTSRSDRWRSSILGGLVLGILMLTKTTLRFLAVPYILLELLLDRRIARRQRFRRAGGRLIGWGGTQLLWILFLWGFQLSLNPLAETGDDWLWVYRGNYVPDQGWETIGVGDAATPELKAAIDRTSTAPPDARRSALYREAFGETLRRHPLGVPLLMLAKATVFWRYPAVSTFVRAGPFDLPPPARWQPILALLGLLGLALCLGRGSHRWLPAAIPLYLMLLHAATHLVVRYNVPAVPFIFVYAAGAVAIGTGAVHDRIRLRGRDGLARDLRDGRIVTEIALAAIGILAALLCHGTAGAASIAGPWFLAVGALPLAARVLGGGRIGLGRGLVFLLPIALLVSATRAADPDLDEGRIVLKEPGDGVRLMLALPPETRAEKFASGAILLDLLPSGTGEFTLSVRLNGDEVGRFVGHLPDGPENLLLDAAVHGAQQRYRRIVRSAERHLEGNLRKHRSFREAGYDSYRQWYRVPVDAQIAFADPNPVIEVVLVASRGGHVALYTDRDAPAAGSPDRVIEMPAFLENAYELSSYRFDAYATDREQADARLTRPIRLGSSRRGAERFNQTGDVESISGEPRLRLRGRLRGLLGLIRTGTNRLEPAFVADSTRVIRAMTPDEIRGLQMDRDRFFDGTLTF